LDFFQEKLSKVSDKHSERFQQDIMAMEKQYEGKWPQVCWQTIAGH
jgi:hypothetical protein